MKLALIRLFVIGGFIMLLTAATFVKVAVGGTGQPGDILSDHTFIDRVGNKVVVNASFEQVISLSPPHTENLFDLGAGDLVIGTDRASIYPYEAALLPKYDLNKRHDIKLLIQMDPDLILIDPALNQSNPSVVSAFETAGIKVVSLMPESVEGYGWYMTKLGILTGHREGAMALARAFYAEMDAVKHGDHAPQVYAFMESSEKGFRTPGPETLPFQAMRFAGIQPLIEDKPFYLAGERYPRTDPEFLLTNNQQMHSFFSLKGDGYSGGDLPSLRQHKVTGRLDAILNNRSYIIKSPLIARFTSRYPEGIRELKRLVYGDGHKRTSSLPMEAPLTRINFATVVYEYLNLPTFVIYRSDYYEVQKYHHTYGAFKDVSWREDDFALIETVVMKSYLAPSVEDGIEYFYRNQPVNQEGIETFLYIRYNLRGEALSNRLASEGVDLNEVTTVGQLITLLEVTEQWP